MMTTLRLCGLSAALLFLAVTASCKQAEGDRCQLDEDCAEGLYCELAGNTRAQGGFCKSPTSTTTTVDLSSSGDLAKPVDMAKVDM